MLDDQIIRQATEEALSELQISAQRFEIEPARQIRFFDADVSDKATVVDFQDKDGNVSIYFDEIKKKIRRQIEVLFI